VERAAVITAVTLPLIISANGGATTLPIIAAERTASERAFAHREVPGSVTNATRQSARIANRRATPGRNKLMYKDPAETAELVGFPRFRD